MNRELLILGTASQAPTRTRNHNGYFLRWDRYGILFDPGEGSQRQMLLAGVPSSAITHICITHFHGDHCLGLPGVLQRISLDDVRHTVAVLFPASGIEYARRLQHAAIYDERAPIELLPVKEGVAVDLADLRIVVAHLDHSIDVLGWRIVEPDSRRMLPEKLETAGVRGPLVSTLQHEGAVEVDGRSVRIEEVSEPRPGQSFAFIMDTRPCAAATTLAANTDLLVCESTFLTAEQHLADKYGHLTAAQAAQIADEAKARRLVLTHFSQRYPDVSIMGAEAKAVFPDIVVGEDLMRVEVPPRRAS